MGSVLTGFFNIRMTWPTDWNNIQHVAPNEMPPLFAGQREQRRQFILTQRRLLTQTIFT